MTTPSPPPSSLLPPALAMASKTCILHILTLILSICLPLSESIHFNFPAVFNFGDSNSDTGELIASGIESLNPPHGQSYFHKPSGRYCDGRLIFDFLSNFLFFLLFISILFSFSIFPCFLRFQEYCLIDSFSVVYSVFFLYIPLFPLFSLILSLLFIFYANCCSGCNGSAISKCLSGFNWVAQFPKRVQFCSCRVNYTSSNCNICQPILIWASGGSVSQI